jgi:hypothetical protein
MRKIIRKYPLASFVLMLLFLAFEFGWLASESTRGQTTASGGCTLSGGLLLGAGGCTLTATQGVFMPEPYNGWQAAFGGTSFSAQTLDATTTSVAFTVALSSAGTLDKVGFLLGTVTTAQDVKVSFQDVSATTGDPDGVIDQYCVVPSASIVSDTYILTGILGSTGCASGTKRTVSLSDMLAVVFEWDSTQGDIQIQRLNGTVRHGFLGLNYASSFAAAAWTKSTGQYPNLALEYATATYKPQMPIGGLTASTLASYNVDSGTFDEAGLRFQIPFPAKVDGAWVASDLDGDGDISLYNTGGAVCDPCASLDKDIRASAQSVRFFVPFTSEQTLAAATTYYLTLKPTTTTNLTLRYMDVDSNAVFGQFAGGTSWYWGQRVDAGGWSDTTTRRPFMGIHVSALGN